MITSVKRSVALGDPHPDTADIDSNYLVDN